MDEAVRTVLVAVRERDWDRLKLALHPYLHWTEPGVKLRGRTKVMALLAGRESIAEPDSYELRDGQVYRWTTTSED